jgi:hypothetical protein
LQTKLPENTGNFVFSIRRTFAPWTTLFEMSFSTTLFDNEFADPVPENHVVSLETAKEIFRFFRECPLFRWHDANNDCEDRANAACLLLDKWRIPNCKAWVFSGTFLKKQTGLLTNNWAYHVAAALPVNEEGSLRFYVIDPATLANVTTIDNWAGGITDQAFSYHFVKLGQWYIFNPASLAAPYWYERNRQNYKWTIQGLAGINGVTKTGKAQLVFNKKRVKKTETTFKQLLAQKSPFT